MKSLKPPPMNKTYTPLIIEGKIYVVVDAPDAPSPLDIHFERKKRIYYSRLFTCTKYETLEQDAPYWEERIGQQVGEKDFRLSDISGKMTAYPVVGVVPFDELCPDMPIQQKEKFSLEDFEKGLMLAGHVTPANEQEAAEKLAVEVYERYKLKVGDKTQYGTIKYIDMRVIIYEDRPEFCFSLKHYTAFPTAIPPQQKQGGFYCYIESKEMGGRCNNECNYCFRKRTQKQEGEIQKAALTVIEELLIKHRSVFDGLDIPHEQKKALLLHFNYSTQY